MNSLVARFVVSGVAQLHRGQDVACICAKGLLLHFSSSVDPVVHVQHGSRNSNVRRNQIGVAACVVVIKQSDP